MGSFLADLVSFQSGVNIPTPVSSVRTVQGTYNGQPVTIDGLGNMTDSSGNPVGSSLPGGVSFGSGASTNLVANPLSQFGATENPSTSQLFQAPNVPAGVSSLINSAQSAVSGAASGWLASLESYLASHAQNVVLVVIGIILIAAGLFSFKQTQTVVNTASRVGKRVAALGA